MNRFDFEDMIEKYKKELMDFNKNSSFKQQNEDVRVNHVVRDEKTQEKAVPVMAVPSDPQMLMNNEERAENTEEMQKNVNPVGNEQNAPQEITELVGTNPDNYNVGRQQKVYDTYDDFLKDNPGKGRLSVRTSAGNGAFPVVNARVVVAKQLNNGQEKIIYDELTDISGEVTGLLLPAPSKSLSEEPNMTVPYATYTVTVTHPNFVKSVYKNVPIFDGIESVQSVNMMPIINEKNEGTGKCI